jgi:hypothetical protein
LEAFHQVHQAFQVLPSSEAYEEAVLEAFQVLPSAVVVARFGPQEKQPLLISLSSRSTDQLFEQKLEPL